MANCEVGDIIECDFDSQKVPVVDFGGMMVIGGAAFELLRQCGGGESVVSDSSQQEIIVDEVSNNGLMPDTDQ